MASLKVWHFFPNPLALSDSIVSIGYYGPYNGEAFVEFNGWGLPDASVIEHAPTEYIAYLKVGYRQSNTAEWMFFEENIRCNPKMYETQNILMFLPYLTNDSTYVAAYLEGHWTVVANFTQNKWEIAIDSRVFLPNSSIQYPQNSDLASVNTIALQGVNIYY